MIRVTPQYIAPSFKLTRHCYVAKFNGNAHWTETSPLFAPSLGWKARPSSPYCKNEYLGLALGEETAAQAVVGSIVWASGKLKKTKGRYRTIRFTVIPINSAKETEFCLQHSTCDSCMMNQFGSSQETPRNFRSFFEVLKLVAKVLNARTIILI